MPFQSEKQRRYLWANEPEIARDWTDTYGSGIAKALGGRIPFYAGSGVASNIDNPANLENQMAFRPNTFLDNRIKTMLEMQNTFGVDQPNLQNLKEQDFKQHLEEQTPLSLPRDEYKGIEGYTADSGMLANDATYVNEIGQGNTGGVIDVEKVKEFLENSKNINPMRLSSMLFSFSFVVIDTPSFHIFPTSL